MKKTPVLIMSDHSVISRSDWKYSFFDKKVTHTHPQKLLDVIWFKNQTLRVKIVGNVWKTLGMINY